MNDRERLVELLHETFEKQYDRNLVIAARPTADYLISHGVTVQKQGRWVRNEWADYVKECSVCGKVPNAIPGRGNTPCYSKFCPNCGAKMDGEADGT